MKLWLYIIKERIFEKAFYLLIIIINIFLAYYTAKPGLEAEQALAVSVFLMAGFFVFQLFSTYLWAFEKSWWPKYIQKKFQNYPGLPIRIFGWVVILFITFIQISALK